MTTQQTTLTPSDYQSLMERISQDNSPQDAFINSLSIHDKRMVVQYQTALHLPVLAGCVLADQKPLLKKLGYFSGYTNKAHTARFWIQTANPIHKRLFVRYTPGKKPRRTVSETPGLKAIGAQVDEIIQASGQSIRSFARQTGLDWSTLAKLRNGKLNCEVVTLEDIVDKMGFQITGVQLTKKQVRN